jgi:alkane 1-monooxygenase
VAPSHSWNSNNIATNVLLYHLQRHSDHHANPTRRYQALRDFEESPVLPTGYAGMILLALVPTVWRRVMDPRVLAHFDGDMARANISPGRRSRVLLAYPPADGSASTPLIESDRDTTTVVLDGHGPWLARCPACGYSYDETRGDAREGFAPGTSWASVPATWVCPDCGVRDKTEFVVTRAVDA